MIQATFQSPRGASTRLQGGFAILTDGIRGAGVSLNLPLHSFSYVFRGVPQVGFGRGGPGRKPLRFQGVPALAASRRSENIRFKALLGIPNTGTFEMLIRRLRME